ncbi:hypothetical protein N0V94_003274 [Neodidymelliopsis sp. IMI 364377]|nr:hypothetical protein N0V94_003274 [Neodidymelliopsis sp. IMI 364377]
MLAPLRRFLRSPNPFINGRAIDRLGSTPFMSRRWLRILLVFAGIAIGVNLFVLFDWYYVEKIPSQILGNQAFHPKPFAPVPYGPGAHDDNGLDYWTWETPSQFKNKAAIGWNGTMDECVLFPKHLLSKIQVVLKTGTADDWSRTEAQLSTVIKCIPNVLIVSDSEHTYGPKHRTVDVLADLPPDKYMKEEDYFVYETQMNASRNGVQLQQGHEGWRIDKYKFLPAVEKAIEHNTLAQWYVFLESDTYMFWDNVFRLLQNYDASLPYFFGSPSPGRKYRPNPQTEEEDQVWFAYGGAGFILSTAAAHRLVDRPRNNFGIKGSRLSTEYEEDIRNDCCGDSILGWALHDKADVSISGLWPMFNPHRLEDVPFGNDYWCEPVISLHKTNPSLFKDLWSWENEKRSGRPLLYIDLLFSFHGNFSRRENWDAAFDAGFQLPDNSTVHASLDACETGCFAHDDCQQYTWHGRHCYYAKALYIGNAKQPDGHHDPKDREYISGWDYTKIQNRSFGKGCGEGPHWVKPSIKRKY